MHDVGYLIIAIVTIVIMACGGAEILAIKESNDNDWEDWDDER